MGQFEIIDGKESDMVYLFSNKGLGGISKYYFAKSRKMIIHEEILGCIGYVGYIKDREFKYAGTCFFVRINEHEDFFPTYIVTAKHVITKIKATGTTLVYLRLNTIHGPQKIPVSINDWIYHKDYHIDIAILPLDKINADSAIFSSLDIKTIIAPQGMPKIGYEIYMPGLFYFLPGTDKNVPIIRIGNISALPGEKIEVNEIGIFEAYLIETRSLGGLSGAPVFVRIPEGSKEKDGSLVIDASKIDNPDTYFLGICLGHWESTSRLICDEIDSITEKNSFNIGIAYVLPAEKIIEVLNK